MQKVVPTEDDADGALECEGGNVQVFAHFDSCMVSR
jgi:hypothetical protein